MRSFFAGDTTFFEAGKTILVAVGKGIWSAVTYPFDHAQEGSRQAPQSAAVFRRGDRPVADLTASGAAVLKTLAKGMLGVLSLPGKVLSLALQGMLNAVRCGDGTV